MLSKNACWMIEKKNNCMVFPSNCYRCSVRGGSLLLTPMSLEVHVILFFIKQNHDLFSEFTMHMFKWSIMRCLSTFLSFLFSCLIIIRLFKPEYLLQKVVNKVSKRHLNHHLIFSDQ